MSDRRLIYIAAFLRALATGMVAVLLGIYLAEINFTAAQIGFVISTGLAGAALSALFVTVLGDRKGRRRSLIVLSLLSGAGGLFAAFASSFAAMAIAAFLGMVNGMGRDRGAALILEQAMLPATASDRERTRVFAWYNVLQDAGHALGGLAAALPALARYAFGADTVWSYRFALIVYSLLLFATAAAYLALSRHSEASGRRTPVSPRAKRVVTKISALFAVDSIAGGFAGTALVAFFFFERFGVTAALIGTLFFAARIANALSHLAAAWLARRIGLLNTMVFTHIPSSVFLIAVPFAPDFVSAAILFVLREALVEMDVPTRQSYVMAVVREEERTFASGVTHLTRLGGWAVAPSFAGWLMQSVALAAPLVIAGGLKIAYDVMLYAAFRRIKPPEE
jgi:MFS family permease